MVLRVFHKGSIFSSTVVFLLSALSFRATVNAGEGYDKTTCPSLANINLSDWTQNATGFHSQFGFLRTEIVWKEDGEWHGCMCDIFSCVLICSAKINPNEAEFLEYAPPNFPLVYTTNSTLEDDGKSGVEPTDRFIFFFWSPCAYDRRYSLIPNEDPDDEWHLLENGALFLPRQDNTLRWRDYCFLPRKNSTTYIPQVCSPRNNPDPYRTAAYIGGLISAPFIIVTIFVYSILPELRSIHGNTFRCYLVCLLITYIAFAANRIPEPEEHIGTTCLVTGFIIYFSFVTSFFWLNVMCFDMWWKFRGYRLHRICKKANDYRKFIVYSIYAWGVPTLLTTVCISLEFIPGIPESVIRPGFTQLSCWFSTKRAAIFFFYGPVGMTILCNICFFVSITIKLIQHKRSIQHQLSSADSKRHDDNKLMFGVYLKLFVIMGISWSMEITSGLWKEDLKHVWYFTDMINALQGILIFIIFVCKKKIWYSLLKWFKSSLRYSGQKSAYTQHSMDPRATTSSLDSTLYSTQCTDDAIALTMQQNRNAESRNPRKVSSQSQ